MFITVQTIMRMSYRRCPLIGPLRTDRWIPVRAIGEDVVRNPIALSCRRCPTIGPLRTDVEVQLRDGDCQLRIHYWPRRSVCGIMCTKLCCGNAWAIWMRDILI